MTNPADHCHYDHYTEGMIERLDGFFGAVDESINNTLADQVDGTTVLEVGCGFGSLVDSLRRRGLSAVGVDMLEFCVAAGKRRYPLADLRCVSSNRLPFPDQSIDTVILKDTFHHVVGESDPRAFLDEVKRICRRRLIIFDPNPTWVLLTARRLIKHTDPVCFPEQAARLLAEAGYSVRKTIYNQVFAFPLSGGYVGKPMVPRFRRLYPCLLAFDGMVLSVLRALGLARHFSWRFLIIADQRS